MKTIIINLIERKDRKEETEKELQKFNASSNLKLDYEFFPAIKPKITDIPKNYLPHNSNYCNIGCWGCLQSHLEVIKLAQLRNWEQVLILEDDVQFSLFEKCSAIFEQALLELPEDWCMLYLCGNHKKQCLPFSKNLVKMGGAYSTCSYLLNVKKYANDIIKILESANEEVDVVYMKNVHSNFNCFCIYPHITTQRPSFSDIQGKFVNYNNILK